MDNVNKTLYIPLYGKAYVSKKGIILHDPKAEEVWGAEGFPLKGKAKTKWLAYYMGMRTALFDSWLKEQLAQWEDAAVIHIGCGLDSRVLRVGADGHRWYDVDFASVIQERGKYYKESECYHMISGDVREPRWLDAIPDHKRAIVVMEGVSMYLNGEELRALTASLDERFEEVALLMDCYTVLAAKLSKYKNPIHDVGVTQVWGMDDPKQPEGGGLVFVKEHDMTPQHRMDELKGAERAIFKKLYGGSVSKKMYRCFEYRKSV